VKKFLHSRDGASKGAALIIVLAFVVLVTVLSVAYFSRTTTDRQLAQSSFNDTTADLLARSALDITVSDLKQEIATSTPVSATNIKPARYPAGVPDDNPNLIRYSSRNAAASRASTVSSTAASANGRSISLARWNSHYLIPRASTTTEIDSTPVASFIPPDWVLVTARGPDPAPAPNTVIGRYAFAVYDEGGLLDMNLGGFPTYANLTRPSRPTRRMAAKYPLEESEIMLAAFAPNAPCHDPKFTPNTTNASGGTGAPISPPITFNTNGTNPQTFAASFLPHGLSIDPSTGTISGIPTSPGTFTITLSVSNACGSDTGTLNLTIDGRIGPDSTPWPVNVARKGTLAFADVTTLPSTPTAITPTTPAGSMGGFPSTTQIGKIMGWRNYATTQQPAVSFDNPSFPLAAADNYAKYFLGAFPPPDYVFTTPFTTVRNDIAPVNARTDQAVMTRQELIKLQRTIGFSQSLLQYLGTFSRESNRPAPDWPRVGGNYLTARFDMNNLQGVLPDSWIHPGHHGIGHAFGMQRHSFISQNFGLVWVEGTFAPGTRGTDPNYYGHWRYFHNLNPLPANNPDFFQIIDYAMNQANGGVVDPNHVRNTFQVGAALIDQYDTDDLFDPDPNPPISGNFGNTITIIDYDGNPLNYAYGIEGMSFDDPNLNSSRPPFAPYPPPVPANYVLLNRRFENVGEFGYAYNPASTLPSKTLDFASSTSKDKPMLDFFTYNTGTGRAGIVNLNTRNGPVLASIIRGALLHDLGSENVPTALFSQLDPRDALTAGQNIVQATTAAGGAAVSRADVARLAAVAAAALPGTLGASDEAKQTIARALAEAGQTRTWNLMIDVIAQTGQYAPGTPDLTDPTKFIVQGEKRYWLHIALDRDDGTVLGTQLEEVIE
jgi:Tfp pilus assembly protein PilX